MNSLVDALNFRAGHALEFLWPMFWQSSLLIMLLFGLDWAIRRKARAAVRYSLWLVLLLKLLLPPSLAFPTGLAWWLRPPRTQPPPPPQSTFVVKYGPSLTKPAVAPKTLAIPTPTPPTKPTLEAMLCCAWGIGALALLACMLARWRSIALIARQAKPAPDWVNQLNSVRPDHASRITHHAPNCTLVIKVTDHRLSPALCGLFRPVILLPRALIDQLSQAQLRAVLFHEQTHLRRSDVWVNCAQALLQVVYWWHPFLWLANARIRRLREEAVDDAVMLALRDDAECYAPTLLEVAKVALQRPLATLCLVGILEPRSSLQKRIERLLEFRPPKKSGVTLASMIGLLSLSALALPMGQAPASNSTPLELVPSAAATQTPGGDMAVDEAVIRITSRISLRQKLEDARAAQARHDLEAAAKLYDTSWDIIQTIGSGVEDETARTRIGLAEVRLELARQDQHRGDLLAAGRQIDDVLRVDPENPAALEFKRSNTKMLAEPAGTIPSPAAQEQIPISSTNRIAVGKLVQDGKLLIESGKLDEAEAKFKEAIKFDPLNQAAHFYLDLINERRIHKSLDKRDVGSPEQVTTNLTRKIRGRQIIESKLKSIHLSSFGSAGLPLSDVIRKISEEAKKRDPEKRGINFIYNACIDAGRATPTGLDPASNSPVSGPPAEQVDVGSIRINVDPPITKDITLADALDTIVKTAQRPIEYSIEDYAVVFSLKGQEATPLYNRTFKMDPRTFEQGLESVVGDAFAATQPNSSGGPGGGIRPATRTNEMANVQRRVSSFFTALGIDWKNPPGKVVFYSDTRGDLLVRATLSDLDLIEQGIQTLCAPPPQVNIKAKIVEVRTDETRAHGFNSYLTNLLKTNGLSKVGGPSSILLTPTNWVASLSETEFQKVMAAMKECDDAKVLCECSITTLSEREASIQWQEDLAKNGLGLAYSRAYSPQLNIVPCIRWDGSTYQIYMMAHPSFPEFLGYTNSSDLDAHERQLLGDINLNGIVLPHFRLGRHNSNADIPDGQTMVLGGIPSDGLAKLRQTEETEGGIAKLAAMPPLKREAEKGQLIIFITPTIIDSKGNRTRAAK